MRASALLLLLAAAVCLASLAVSGQSSCPSARTYDAVPPNAGFSKATRDAVAALATDSFIRLGCSEKVSVYTQTTPYRGELSTIPGTALEPSSWADNAWPRVDCPHLASDLTPFASAFPSLTAGADITVKAGSKLLLRGCTLPTSSDGGAFRLGRLTVQRGAVLVVDDVPLSLRVREIKIEAGGKLLAGSATCRLFSNISIEFLGSGADSARPSNPATAALTSKGFNSFGVLDIHGKQFHPTWTRLARTASNSSGALASVIFLQEPVNWEVGQQVLVTTTILMDCNDEQGKTWCVPCYAWEDKSKPACAPVKHQNEVRTIVALDQSKHLPSGSRTRFSALQLDRPLSYKHYAGLEYQAEVALLSRRIQVSGADSGDRFGAHISIQGTEGEGRLSGVSCANCGQLNELGRYPFHMHMLTDTAGSARSFFQDSAVLHSNFRAFVVHGSNHTRFSRNVAFNVTGMALYLEDGVEENNLIEYNLMAHVHPIFRPANGPGGQGGESFAAQSGLLIPADTSASGFYALNAYNVWVGNVASGGWSGFVFPNAPTAMGDYKQPLSYYKDPAWQPMNRPLLKFIGNQAHSSGYHWTEHGSCMYVGAWLTYNSAGVMTYNSGRNNRNSRWPNGTTAIDKIEDMKVSFCNKGIAHWGNNAELRNVEFHDIRVSSMLFGESSMINALVNGKTPNQASSWVVARGKMGFQFYDTYTKTILSGVQFRNYDDSITSDRQYAIRYMDHSDHYSPQGINAVRGISYSNVGSTARLGIGHCGPNCPVAGANEAVTMSARIYSVWDADGSMSGTNRPSIMGSWKDWWNHSPELACEFKSDLHVWVCPWSQRASVAFIGPYVPRLGETCDTAKFSTCTDQYSPATVGSMSQWGGSAGAARSVEITQWAGVAGHANTGWLWRSKAADYGIDGAPSLFYISNVMQLPRNNFVVLAVAYPAGATIKVSLQSQWWAEATDLVLTPSTYAQVTAPREELKAPSTFSCPGSWWAFCDFSSTGGTGPAYVVQGGFLYLRVVNPACYNKNQMNSCDGNYTSGGVSVPDVTNGFRYKVQVTACSGCSVQSTLSTPEGSVSFYTVADTAPASRFPTDFGALRTAPATPAAESVTLPTCAAPSSKSYNAAQQLDAYQPGNPATIDPITGAIGPLPAGPGSSGTGAGESGAGGATGSPAQENGGDEPPKQADAIDGAAQAFHALQAALTGLLLAVAAAVAVRA